MDIDNNPLSRDELFTLQGFAVNAFTSFGRCPNPVATNPVICGSGGKYKQCCADLEGLDMCSDYNMLRHVLALYRCNQKGKALTRLADMRHRQAEAIRMLVASNPRQPKLKEGVITLGGKDEAWLCRESCLSLWQ